MAATKKSSKRTTKPRSEVVNEPVVIRVKRTVRQKAANTPADETVSIDQVNPDQDPENTEVDVDTIEVRPFVTEPAKVTYNYGLSRSVQFQTVHVGVSVTIPCYKEEIEDAMEQAKKFCADRLKQENAKVDGVLNHLVDLRIKADQELNKRGIA